MEAVWAGAAVCGMVTAVCWAVAAVVIGVKYDRLLKRRSGL